MRLPSMPRYVMSSSGGFRLPNESKYSIFPPRLRYATQCVPGPSFESKLTIAHSLYHGRDAGKPSLMNTPRKSAKPSQYLIKSMFVRARFGSRIQFSFFDVCLSKIQVHLFDSPAYVNLDRCVMLSPPSSCCGGWLLQTIYA